METFAEKLKKAKKAAGMTQQKMADLMLIPKRTIEDWDRGIAAPPAYVQRFVLNELKALADARTAENSDGLPAEKRKKGSKKQ